MTHLCAGSCGRTWAGEHGSTICLGGFVVTRRCWTCSGRRRDGRRIDGKCMTASWTCRDSWRACRRMGPGHPLVPELAAVLSAHYGRPLEQISLAAYRTGRDSVAFHGDRLGRGRNDAVVAIVALGRAPALPLAADGRWALPGIPTSAGATFSSWAGRVSAPGSTGCQGGIRRSAGQRAVPLVTSRGVEATLNSSQRGSHKAPEKTRSRRHTPRERPAQTASMDTGVRVTAWRDRAPSAVMTCAPSQTARAEGHPCGSS